ncbi:MAG: hypothetical protein GXX78_01830 [Bacteroidales bacterium]|mgnify:CR=1 FL=1|nr:hypothetical protein [Bacteroidales bacterium]
MKNCIRIESQQLPKSVPSLRKLDDQTWKNCIFSYLLTYYRDTDSQTIQDIIAIERQRPIAEIEKAIKKHIRRWFDNNEKFQYEGFILNNESSSEGVKEGYYDLKFEHSYWNNPKTYFAFECKNLGASRLIDEYVYAESTKKIDGGMYRFFIGKYGITQHFGGMIGFIIEKTNEPIIEKLIEKIISVYVPNSDGELVGGKIARQSIFDNTNTFDSIHARKNISSNINEEFRLHHLIMDFTL